MNYLGNNTLLRPWNPEETAGLELAGDDDAATVRAARLALAAHPRGDGRLLSIVLRRVHREAAVRHVRVDDRVLEQVVDEVVRSVAVATGTATADDRAWLWVKLDRRVHVALGSRESLLQADERHDFACDYVVRVMERLDDPADESLADYDVARLPIEVWLAPRRIVRLRSLDFARARRGGGREVSLGESATSLIAADDELPATSPTREAMVRRVVEAVSAHSGGPKPSAAWILLALQLWPELQRSGSCTDLITAAAERVATAQGHGDTNQAVADIAAAHAQRQTDLLAKLHDLADEREARHGSGASQRLQYVGDRQTEIRFEMSWNPLDAATVVDLLGLSTANVHQQCKRLRDLLADILRPTVEASV